MRLSFCLLAGLMLSPSILAQDLVILSESGQQRDGLPVLSRHPRNDEIADTLNRGLLAHMVRLYGIVQRFRERTEGVPAEPAYLLLSSNQGGFPRYGFFLDQEEKPGVAYVDLHQSSPLTGSFAAADQIFPHELGHIFIRQLVGEVAEGGSNQVHAIGLRTDPFTAFNEGFGEHFQILALDDPDADPETARLALNHEAEELAWRNLEGYRRELESRWLVATPFQMRFLFWYTRGEDVLRYHAVKANAFSRQVSIPEPLLQGSRLYRAYLLQAIATGGPDQSPKPVPVQLSSEGVVSYFWWRWMTHPTFLQQKSEASVYQIFQVDPDGLPDLENAFLKLFYTFSRAHPEDLAGVIRSYRQLFPAEEPAMTALVREVFGTDEFPEAPAIWLANPDFLTGTTIFDQFRGLPRQHTFDLNTANLVDLMGVPGMTLQEARGILQRVPFNSLDEFLSMPSLDSELKARFEKMAWEMDRLRTAEEEGLDLSLSSILAPYWQRALAVWLAAGLAGGLLYRLVRRIRVWRAILNGVGIAFVYLVLTWIVGGMAGWPAFGSTAIFWLPAALWQLRRARRLAGAAVVLAAWLLALLPAVVLSRPWF